jgi:hypothetical protein
MTQFEVRNGLMQKVVEMIGFNATKHSPSYAPGCIMAMEGGAATIVGLMPTEIRRTKPGSTRNAFAKAQAHRGW